MLEEVKLELEKIKNQCPEFFEQVSPNLLEFILSEETSSKIAQICLENGVRDEEKIEKIAYRVTFVLLKQTPKEKLPEILEKEVQLNSETAKKIYTEINQFIFSHLLKPGVVLQLKENF